MQIGSKLSFVPAIKASYKFIAIHDFSPQKLAYTLTSFFQVLLITKICPCNIQRFFSAIKMENFQLKNFGVFHVFAQNIYCIHEYPQSMFWIKNKKTRFTPANPSFSI